MAFGQDDQRQTYTGNWTCSSCNKAITELPFQPDPSRVSALLCRDCHRERAGSRRDGRRSFGPREPRQTFKGNWTCSSCGAEITELPFQPDPARMDSILCRDCHRNARENRAA